MNKTIMIAILSLMLGACATTGSSTSTDSQVTAETAAQAIASAEAARAKAAAVGYEWRDTGALIDDARKAAEAKDYNKATNLAKEAENQAVSGVKQYELEKSKKH